MKKFKSILLVSLFIFSCQKEKDASIVGYWEQISLYRPDSSGQFSWSLIIDMYPPALSFTPDGYYAVAYREPLGGGVYSYNNLTHQLTFKQLPSGNISVSNVSSLDDEYLVIDHISNGILQSKSKYHRKQF
ncbi:MAG TPA: hypothetical protein VF487_16660 [Chitinophagaceae bacterium]